MTLLQLSPPGSGLSPKLLTAPGGFLWWYADLVDEWGDGLVVIWSFGLPFLPGYAAAARQGRAELPGARPSLNVSTYRKGKIDFYLLQEYTPEEVSWEQSDQGDTWRFGTSNLASTFVDGERRLSLELRLDVPSTDQTATILVNGRGPGCCVPGQCHDPSERCQTPLPDHDWVPLLVCPGEAIIETDGSSRRLTGRLYHDRNGGKTPLHDLGIDSWQWGRIAFEEQDLIFYVLDGEDGQSQELFLAIDEAGNVRSVPASLERRSSQRNLGGLSWWKTLHFTGPEWGGTTVEFCDVVDSGPFYLRSILKVTDAQGGFFRGVGEACQPARVDLAHFRPLVRMRVHHRQADNSIWLPLFTGPRQGRIKRLAQSFLSPLRGRP